jgi:hypothetical protein
MTVVKIKKNKKEFCHFIRIKHFNPTTGLDKPLGLQEVQVPRISKQAAHEDGKVVSHTHQLPLTPGDISGTHFC